MPSYHRQWLSSCADAIADDAIADDAIAADAIADAIADNAIADRYVNSHKRTVTLLSE
jgi:hypothetical protein